MTIEQEKGKRLTEADLKKIGPSPWEKEWRELDEKKKKEEEKKK